MRFIDESPERYAPINDGDYAPMGFDGARHFVKMAMIDSAIVPAHTAACGAEVPNWRENPKAYPICGVVDCPECLKAAG